MLILLTQLTMAASILKQLATDFEYKHRSDRTSCIHPVSNLDTFEHGNCSEAFVDII